MGYCAMKTVAPFSAFALAELLVINFLTCQAYSTRSIALAVGL